ncbi:MAG: hypothetical protein ABI806_13525 [Candidatus Solibacter sp.]
MSDPIPSELIFIFIKSSCFLYDFFSPLSLRLGVEARNEMLLALERILATRAALPLPAKTQQAELGLNISVVFTTVAATLEALRHAGDLASRLSGHITLVVPQIVPYPLPLTSPPILIDWNERRFHVMASESPVETKVMLYLCRDRIETLMRVLTPRSLIVMGGRKRWWPTAETLLARRLRNAGHEVIFTETE